MDIIYLLLPASLILALCGLWAFIWASRNGQFEDLDTPPYRILFDDPEVRQQPPSRNLE